MVIANIYKSDDNEDSDSSYPNNLSIKLVKYIKMIADFEIVQDFEPGYSHMGATIMDAILQAGITYATVVEPRVQFVLQGL